jgi:hypothetical protein
MRRGPGRGHDRGETLVELLVAIAVMSTAVVTIIGATATAIRLSGIHREQAKAGAYLREFAEAIEASVANSPTGYRPCNSSGLTATYTGYYTNPPSAPYQPDITAIRAWDGTGFTIAPGASCSDPGVQRVSLRVRNTTDNVSETLDIVIRRPCRPTDTDTSCA